MVIGIMTMKNKILLMSEYLKKQKRIIRRKKLIFNLKKYLPWFIALSAVIYANLVVLSNKC